MATQNEIGPSTRITLGVLWAILSTLVVGVVGGTGYLVALKSDVVAMTSSLADVRRVVEGMSAKLDDGGRSIAILQTLVATINERIDQLQRRVEMLEANKR